MQSENLANSSSDAHNLVVFNLWLMNRDHRGNTDGSIILEEQNNFRTARKPQCIGSAKVDSLSRTHWFFSPPLFQFPFFSALNLFISSVLLAASLCFIHNMLSESTRILSLCFNLGAYDLILYCTIMLQENSADNVFLE